MTKRQLRILKDQLQVKVGTPAQNDQVNFALLVTFAFAFSGLFFFFGEILWRVLTGG
jgi:hypothetical protein